MFKKTIPQKITYVLLISLLTLFIITGCVTSGKTFTADDNNKEIKLKVDEAIKIKLQSNPTTGYSWNLSGETDASIISLTSSDYKTSSSDKEVVGAGGYDTITFKAVAKGNTTIILTYNKSWEENIEPEDTFKLNITVD